MNIKLKKNSIFEIEIFYECDNVFQSLRTALSDHKNWEMPLQTHEQELTEPLQFDNNRQRLVT